MMMRSPGLSSTLRPISFSCNPARISIATVPLKRMRGQRRIKKAEPKLRLSLSFEDGSAEETEYCLVRLRGKRQGHDRQLLTSLQRRQVGAFQVGVGQGQVIRARLEGIDQVLGEVLTGLHDRQRRAELRSLAAQRGGR